MRYQFISTWKMSYSGMCKAVEAVQQSTVAEAVLTGIMSVEDDVNVNSVGYGGLPDETGVLTMDAGYMDGTSKHYGAVGCIRDIRHPIQVAYALSKRELNCLLVGEGAERFAKEQQLEERVMLTEAAKEQWDNKKKQTNNHDTVCFIGQQEHNIVIGVSTSGLCNKKPGRVGDSPIIGSGYYADSAIGACGATGVGENIMRGCLSYATVQLMKQGMSAQDACETAIQEQEEMLLEAGLQSDSISIVALDAQGRYGAATTNKEFPFVIADETNTPQLMVAFYDRGKRWITQATDEWLQQYQGD